MPTTRSVLNVCGYLGLILAVGVTSHCGTFAPLEQNNRGPRGGETLNYLDLSKPTFSQAIERASDLEGAKFVQVEVVEVSNPKQYALTFIVRYQPDSNTKVDLGTFSLFPADNPGRFLVALQGKVRPQGAIVVTVMTPDKVDSKDTIRVGVKKLVFVKG